MWPRIPVCGLGTNYSFRLAGRGHFLEVKTPTFAEIHGTLYFQVSGLGFADSKAWFRVPAI